MATHIQVDDQISFRAPSESEPHDQNGSGEPAARGETISVTPDQNGGVSNASDNDGQHVERVADYDELMQVIRGLKVAIEQRGDGGSSDSGEHRSESPERDESVTTQVVSHMPKLSLRPPRFDGKTDWEAFISQFDNWVSISGYSTDACGRLLGYCLDASAQVFYAGICLRDRQNYARLLELLSTRYGGKQSVEIYKAQLTSRYRKPNESLAGLRDEIWGLVRKAYRDLDQLAQEALALDALLRAVDFDLRVRCVDQRCANMDEAVIIMERYEALLEADPSRRRKQVRAVEAPMTGSTVNTVDKADTKGGDQFKKIETLLERVLKAVEKHESDRRKPVGRKPESDASVICFRCSGRGHYARNCPESEGKQSEKSKQDQGNGKPLARH